MNRKVFSIMGFIVILLIHSGVYGQQHDLDSIWEQRNKLIEESWQKRNGLIEQGWKIRSEIIERDWEEQRKIILSKWATEQKRLGVLHDVDYGEDNNTLFKTELDFEKDRIQVTGVGYGNTKEDAHKSAISLAKEKLQQRNLDLSVNSETKLREGLKDSSLKISEKDVAQMIKVSSYPTRGEIAPLKDGGFQATIVAEQPLHGEDSISKIMIEIAGKLVRNKKIKELLNSDIASSVLEKAMQLLKGQSYTGLIIDALDMDIKPCMAPTVITEGGKEVYGALVIEKKYALDHGMALWAKSIEDAKKESRIGDNPLVVKAIGKVGNFMVVVNLEEAAKILIAGDKTDFLKKCKVVIVVG